MLTYKVFKICLLFTVNQLFAKSQGAHPWDYGDGKNGPAHWKEYFPYCGGTRQSPIDINTTATSVDPFVCNLCTGYNKKRNGATMHNNGLGVQIRLSENEEPPCTHNLISGKKYCLDDINFHWSTEDSRGSEHLIDGKAGALEMHVYHTNVNKQDKGSDAFLITAVLFQVSDKPNDALTPITNALNKVLYLNSSTQVDSFVINSLAQDWYSYYYYDGSFTTPTCDENIMWIVLDKPSSIGKDQIQQFRKILRTKKGEEPKAIAPNIRPPQDLSGRKVYKPYINCEAVVKEIISSAERVFH